MRRFWLALLVVASLVPAAPAAAEAVSRTVGEPRPSVEDDHGLPGTQLARSSSGVEFLGGTDSRSREIGGRDLHGRSASPRAEHGAVCVADLSALHPPRVPPAPSHAERLPYHSTAPPLLS